MRIFLLLLLLVAFFSCTKEKIAIPDIGRRIVINGLITTDSLLNVYINRSSMITDTVYLENDLIKNAHVYFYQNNELIDSLFYINHFFNFGVTIYVPTNYWSKRVYPIPGKEYKILVKAPGLPDATSTITIPKMVKIEKIDTSRITLSKVELWQSNIRFLCNITFADPVNEKNYYLLYIYSYPNISDNYPLNIAFACDDPVVEEKLNQGTMMEGVAFSDKSINGQIYSLSVLLDGKEIGRPFMYNDDPNLLQFHKTTLYFRLYSITENYFKYIQTLNLFYKNYKNPLASPTQVYSNITGGYGIFAGAAVSSDSIVFHY